MLDPAGHSITYRITVGPHRRRKVFKLRTLPDIGWEGGPADAPNNVAGFSLQCRRRGQGRARHIHDPACCDVPRLRIGGVLLGRALTRVRGTRCLTTRRW